MNAAATEPRRYSATTVLWLLLAVLAVPVVAFAGFVLIYSALAEQDRVGKQAVQIAALAGRIVDNELTGLGGFLRGLAMSSELAAGEYARFYSEAQQIAAQENVVVVLRDLGQRQIINTQRPFGAELPPAVAISDTERAAFDAGELVIGDVYLSPISGEARVPLAMPVTVGSEKLVVAITLPTDRIFHAIAPVVPEGWTVAIGDRNGIIVARSARHEEVTGKPGLPDYLEKAKGPSGLLRSTGFDGTPFLGGYVRSGTSGWLIAANIPVAQVEQPLWHSIFVLGAVALAALALAGLLAFLFAKRFGRLMEGLKQRAQALGEGTPVAPLHTHILELDLAARALMRASDERLEAERRLADRSHELEVVLDTAPAAVWFTRGDTVRTVERNRAAAELMQVPADNTDAIGSGTPALQHLRLLQGDEPVPPDQLPLQRALRGEELANEEFVFAFADGTERTMLTSARPLRPDEGDIVGAVSVSIDITERKRAETQRRLLTNELNHRVKNTLASVQSVAAQTLRTAGSLKAAELALSSRLQAMARAHDILTRESWQGASVTEIVEGALSPSYADRITRRGPNIRLPPTLALNVALALHELATNAAKYGALSTANGRVHIGWSEESNPHRLRLTWQESGGPAVAAPTGTGFGMRLLNGLFRPEAGGLLETTFAPQGFQCIIEAAMDVAPLQSST